MGVSRGVVDATDQPTSAYGIGKLVPQIAGEFDDNAWIGLVARNVGWEDIVFSAGREECGALIFRQSVDSGEDLAELRPVHVSHTYAQDQASMTADRLTRLPSVTVQDVALAF